MSTLYKYWLKEFGKLFLIIQLLVLVLTVFIDYLSRLERFLNSDISLVGALGYILLKVPFFFVQLTPASVLLAGIVTFGLMNRNNELLAVKSSGISVYHMIKPVLFAGVLLTALVFFLGETLIPATMSRSNFIKYSMIKKRRMATQRKDIWIKSENRFIHINFFDLTKQAMAGITITQMDDGFRMIHRMDARYGVYLDGKWQLHEIVDQQYDEKTDDYQIRQIRWTRVDLDIRPEELSEVVKKSDEMSFIQTRELVRRIEKEGYDATRYRTDMHGKIAFPFICLIMILTGTATGMRSIVKNNLPIGIGIGVVIAFSYWVIFGFSLSLGYGHILPPVVAAWAANVIFFCLGIISLISVE